MGPGGDAKVEYWRDACGVEVVRVAMGPASWWLHVADALTPFYVVSGQGLAHVRGDIVPLHEGATMLSYPHEVGVSRTTQEPLILASFQVPRDVLRSGSEVREGEVLAGRPDERLAEVARRLIAELGPGASVVPHSAELLALLPDARTVALGRPKPTVLEPGAVRRARLFLERNFRATTSLDDLASESGTSNYHLVRMFRAYHGIPQHTYLTSYRLAIARRMLASGVRGSDAAVATGFADQSHFSRSFRRMLGIAPHAYARLGGPRDDASRKRPRDESLTDA